MSTDYRGLFEGWEIAVAKKLVGEFRSHWKSLQREGFEDLLQDCLIHWYRVREAFDPARETSHRTFMVSVVRNKLMDIVREHESDKRKVTYLSIPIDEPVGGAEDAPFVMDAIDEHRATETGVATEHSHRDARIDIAKAIAQLTPAQQRLCRLLGEEGLSIQQASERLGIPRSSLYDEIKRIRKIFTDFGLSDYLRS